jgi:hypothetical protein
LKLMFDRLVCMNGGNPREDLIQHKDPEMAMALEQSPEWEHLSRNHLEGRTAAFFCHGDAGGDEIGPDGRPKKLRHKEYFDPGREPFPDDRESYAPLVWQCRYSGIEVPDTLWRYGLCGAGRKYSRNQAEHMSGETEFLSEFDSWADAFARFVERKGKVQPGEYRAYGYKAPGHTGADLKAAWRTLRMAAGAAPEGSSPARQHEQGLNRDATLVPVIRPLLPRKMELVKLGLAAAAGAAVYEALRRGRPSRKRKTAPPGPGKWTSPPPARISVLDSSAGSQFPSGSATRPGPPSRTIASSSPSSASVSPSMPRGRSGAGRPIRSARRSR